MGAQVRGARCGACTGASAPEHRTAPSHLHLRTSRTRLSYHSIRAPRRTVNGARMVAGR